MADINSLTGFLSDVANTIREKDGIAGNIYPKDFDNRIRNIPTGGRKVNNLYSFSFYNGKASSYDRDIQSINTASVQNLDNAFYNCTNLSNLSEFQTTNVKSMKNMLYNCNKLTNASLCNIVNMLPLYSNITDNAKNPKLTYLGLLSSQIDNIPESLHEIIQNKGWSIGELIEFLISYNIVDNFQMINISGAGKEQNIDEIFLNTMNNLGQSSDNRKIVCLDFHNSTENITNFSKMCFRNNLYTTTGTYNTFSWSNLSYIYNLKTDNAINLSGIFGQYIDNYTTGKIKNLPDINLLKVQDFSLAFMGQKDMTGILPSHWNFSNCTDLGRSFRGCSNLSCDIPNWDLSNCNSISDIFDYCYNLTCSVPNWDLSNCVYISSCFGGCNRLTGTIPNWNTYKVITAFYAFQGCSNLTGSLPNWNFSNCTNTSQCFGNLYALSSGCKNLTGSIPNFNLSKVFDASGMFGGCENLTGSIPNFNLSNCRIVSSMFANCKNLIGTIPNFDLSKCHTITNMFTACENLTGSIPNWNTSNIKNFNYIFNLSSNLTGPLPNWDFSNAINCVGTFGNICPVSSYIPNSRSSKINGVIPNYNLQSVRNAADMFANLGILEGDISNLNLYQCKNINNIFIEDYYIHGNISFINLSNVTNMGQAFRGCHNITANLEQLQINSQQIRDFSDTFYGCFNIRSHIPNFSFNNKVKFCTTKFGHGMFSGCNNLIGQIPAWDLTNVQNLNLSNCFNNCVNITDFHNNFKVNMSIVSYKNIFTNCFNLSKNAIYNIMNIFAPIHPQNAQNDFFTYIGLNNSQYLTNLAFDLRTLEILFLISNFKNNWPTTVNRIAAVIDTGIYDTSIS